MKIDLLYLLTKSNWGEEIRYSLRSFEQHFPELGKVWIVGYLPPYINPDKVNHIPEPKVTDVYVESAIKRFVNKHLKDLSEDYIFSSDDHYLLRDLGREDFCPYWVQDLDKLPNRGTDAWQLMLWRTYDLLKFMGISDCFNYESHSPSIVNRKKYDKLLTQFKHVEKAAKKRYDGICSITAYWNLQEDASEIHRYADDYRVGFTNKGFNQSPEAIKKATENKLFLYHDDAGLSHSLKTFLQTTFPEKSRFEF